MDDKLKLYKSERPAFKVSEPTPFSVCFTWQNETITVELKDGKDILRLASVFSLILTDNGIEHNIKIQDK